MSKVVEIYKHCKTNSKPMLMTSELINMYPAITGATRNFVEDYINNATSLDRVFTLKYGSRDAFFIEDNETFPAIYNNWIENCNDFVIYHMDAWARLYYALEQEYNPIWNYDGKNVIETKGFTNIESGTESNTYDYGAVSMEDRFQNTHGETRDYSVAYDMTEPKLVGKSETDTDMYTTVHSENPKHDSDAHTFGKNQEIDTTVTETKGGNQGTTMTQQMLDAEWELRTKSFWDMVFNTLSAELTLY